MAVIIVGGVGTGITTETVAVEGDVVEIHVIRNSSIPGGNGRTVNIIG